MINFNFLEDNLDELSAQFSSASPYEHVVIDQFCDPVLLSECLSNIPNPDENSISKSRDYIFAKNKFEKSSFKELCKDFSNLYDDLTSERFERFLYKLTGEKVFLDKEFHGGGIHQGGRDSFLDMHVDFNLHPLHSSWFRNVNILIYLNKDWKLEWGGQLDMQHIETKKSKSVDPIFNRCVIMFTRDYTVHGYKKISFPSGNFRRSIAAYAYSFIDSKDMIERSTKWMPKNAGFMKTLIGKNWPRLVKIKTTLFGSATEKNK